MQLAALHQSSGYVRGLQRRAFGRRMGRQIAGDRNQDVPALVGIAPNGELSDPRFQHLIGMEAGVLAEHCQAKGDDQPFRRMAELKMPCYQPCRLIDLSLSVEGIEQGGADRFWIRWQVVELFATLA